MEIADQVEDFFGAGTEPDLVLVLVLAGHVDGRAPVPAEKCVRTGQMAVRAWEPILPVLRCGSSLHIAVDGCAMMPCHAAVTWYLGLTNVVALLRLLPGSDRDKDAEMHLPKTSSALVGVGA